MGRRVSLLRSGFAASAVALGAFAVGCGGDDEPLAPIDTATGATGPALTQESFIEQADRICAESNVAIAQLTAGDLDEDAVIGQELSITEGQLNSLRSLGEPPEDAGTYGEFLSAMDDVVAALERQELAAERGEDTSAPAGTVERAREEATEAADDFGFEECGQEGEPLDLEGGGDGNGTGDSAPPAPAPSPEAPAPEAPAPPPPPPAPPSGGTGDSPSGGGGGGGGGGNTGGVQP